MPEKIQIAISANERDELVNALCFYMATLEMDLPQQDINRINCLLDLLGVTDE